MFRYARILLSALATSLFLAVSAFAACPEADLNGDCRVDLADMHIFAEQWLMSQESSGNLNGDKR